MLNDLMLWCAAVSPSIALIAWAMSPKSARARRRS
jgi:hypothetical protein